MFHGNVSLEIAKGLKTLGSRIEAANIPSSKLDETLNIATWNIREFGRKRRSEAAIHYIAEIIGQFDVVGIVELRDDLSDLARVLPILGPYWRAVYSDAMPDPGGNRERVAYVYDTRAAVFTGLAAEAQTPRAKKGTEYLPQESFWRAPYLASFRAGDFDFVLLTTHVRWSEEGDRLRELELLANWIEAKRLDRTNEDRDLLVMGDFNIPTTNGPHFKAITKHGLQIPRALRGLTHGSNLEKDKRYDQILHYATFHENFSGAGGVVDFYAGNHKPLFPDIDKAAFTYQMSDHLPLWMQIRTDIDSQKLDQLIQVKDKG
ncbi:MAG: endonuclease/exonuclease/phosphatase family protein [Rhodospirillales bacterium]|nr:MAG: endonuclease/exonuclease/phosphatase family protein [Rhodospirillales bacterium]